MKRRRPTRAVKLFTIQLFTAQLNYTQLLSHTLERLQAFIEVILRMRGGDHHADSRLALWHGWEAEGHGEHPCLK